MTHFGQKYVLQYPFGCVTPTVCLGEPCKGCGGLAGGGGASAKYVGARACSICMCTCGVSVNMRTVAADL